MIQRQFLLGNLNSPRQLPPIPRKHIILTECIHHRATNPVFSKGSELNVTVRVKAIECLKETDRTERRQIIRTKFTAGRKPLSNPSRQEQNLALILSTRLLARQALDSTFTVTI